MQEVLRTLKQHNGIAIGAIGGYFVSGTAIGMVEKAAAPVVGKLAASWIRVGSSVAVAAAALWLGKKMGKAQIGTAFAGVTLGHGIAAGMTAVKGS